MPESPRRLILMKITVYNFKGGTGKTSIALNLALTMHYGIITNDSYSPLEKVLPENKFIKLEADQDLPDLPEKYSIIFDLGGRISSEAISAVKQSNWVLVPTTADYIDLQVTINCINELKQYNDRIIIIGNRTVKGEFNLVQRAIQKFFNYPVFEVKRSRSMPNIFREKKSVMEMCNEGGLKRFHYAALNDQFNVIIDHLEGVS